MLKSLSVGINRIGPNAISIDIETFKKIYYDTDNTIEYDTDNAIVQFMKSRYPEISYTKSIESEYMYIDITEQYIVGFTNIELFNTEIKYIIFRFNDVSKMDTLLKLYIKKNYINYILIFIILLFIIYIIVSYIQSSNRRFILPYW